jgi:lipid-binding SYLF domain-containing protein
MKTVKILLVVSAIILSGNLFASVSIKENRTEHKKEKTIIKSNKSLVNATSVFEEIMESHENSIPESLLNETQGIIIVPNSLKVAIGWGGKGGRGIALIRKDDGTWSNPVYIVLGEGSWGIQFGAEKSDIVLLFKDSDQILKLAKADVSLGADIEVVVGPAHSNNSAKTNIKFDAEIYDYVINKGLFAGVSINGGVLKSNNMFNQGAYANEDISMNEIFFEMETPANENINNLHSVLGKY